MPHRRAVPGRCRQRALSLARGCGIAVVLREPRLHLGASLGQRVPAPVRGTGRVDLLERPDDCGQVECRLERVDLLDGDRLAVDPGVDLPVPRIARARPALRDRDGDLDPDDRSELREPSSSLLPGVVDP